MENTLYLLNLDSMNQFDEFSEKEQEKKCHGFNEQDISNSIMS